MAVLHDTSVWQFPLSELRVEPEAVRSLPEAIARRYDVLALSANGNELSVALPDPDDTHVLDHVRFATGMRVRAVGAGREEIRERLAAAYGNASRTYDEASDDPPVVRLLRTITENAVRARASDVHVERCGSRARVRQRVDGVLHDAADVPVELYDRLVSRIKLLSGMDIADRRQPQDGRCALDAGTRRLEARVSSIPTADGEKIALRLFDPQARIPSLDELGMTPDVLASYRRLLSFPQGCLIVCGPTGSGKTTTLYASLAERNDASRQLCSIEDPVELHVPGVAQIQINTRAGLTFEAALRAVVRQDPDAIMIGEIRDRESAHAAIAAALAGQLVLTTVHSQDAASAIERLVGFGIKRQSIAAGLSGIVSERLVRVRRPSGRYAGRVGIFELLPMNGALSACVASGASADEIRNVARAQGCRSLRENAAALVASGVTSSDEVARVLGRDL